MNSREWRVTLSLAAVYAVRMLGLFMILPVFALYAQNLPDATPAWVGLAIGIYGLTQAIFQIPLGIAADKVGRKPVIVGGLLFFIAGSIVAALADTVLGVAIGRAIQGMGAVAAATMALAADLIREEYRVRTLGIIGLTIGLSFMAGIALGPLVAQWGGVPAIFWFTALLGGLGIALVLLAVPNPPRSLQHRDAGIIRDYLGAALRNPALLRMDIGVFVLHLVMTANFLALPLLFSDTLGLPTTQHWQIYLPVLVTAFLLAVPLIIVAEKRQKIVPLMLLATAAIVLAELAMGLWYGQPWLLLAAFLLFFVGFNFLEAVQPSLVVKYAAVHTKGTAMGVFGSAQFLGIFSGGAIGGLVHHAWGNSSLFLFCAAVTASWLALAWHLPRPQFYASRILKLAPHHFADPDDLERTLLAIPGMKEVALAVDEGLAYLKYDRDSLDETALRAFSATAT